MIEDWRLTNQLNYLYRSRLIWSKYVMTDKNDHDHCEFCWEKFGEEEGMIHNGYCTTNRYRWICPKCFDDFKDMFQWRVVVDTGDRDAANQEDGSLSE